MLRVWTASGQELAAFPVEQVSDATRRFFSAMWDFSKGLDTAFYGQEMG